MRLAAVLSVVRTVRIMEQRTPGDLPRSHRVKRPARWRAQIAGPRRREQIATVITLSELGYEKPTWTDALRLVTELNRDAALTVLAQFNLFLAVSSIQAYQQQDIGVRRWAQEKLISNSISQTRLDELKAKLGNADLADRILVHRSLVLAALKLVAVHAQPEGGNKLEKREDFAILGELALIINSTTEPDANELTACDIAAQMAPSRELENHPDLGLTVVRMQRMLGTHLQHRAAKATGHPKSLEEPSRFSRL